MLFNNIQNLCKLSIVNIRQTNNFSQIGIKNNYFNLSKCNNNNILSSSQRQSLINRFNLSDNWKRTYFMGRGGIINNTKNNNFSRKFRWFLKRQFGTTSNKLTTIKNKKIPIGNDGGKLQKINKNEIKRLFSLARNEKWILIAGIGCLIISSTITLSVPYALGKILDIIYNENKQAKEMLKKFCLIFGGIFLIGGVANFGRVYLFNSASLRIVKDLRIKLYRTMLNQETGWFDTKGTGELINRLSADTFFVGNSLSQNISDGLRSMVTIIAGTGMMIYTSPQLAMVSLCVVPCVGGIAIVYGRYIRNITKRLLDQYAEIMKVGEERLNNIKTVKIFCKEKQESQLFLNELLDALQLGYKEVLARASFYGITGLSGNIIIISVLYYGGTLVANQELTVGALTSFILYAGYTGLSMGGISNFYTELNKGLGSAERIWEIFDRQYSIPYDDGISPLTKPKGSIQFQNVTFNFPSRMDSPVLQQLNLNIAPGTVTAVVGRSGSGKSTIAILLLRLYDPQSGDVILDGQNLKDLNPLWLRSHIGAVNQEPILFSGTIRENILYGLNPGDRISESEFQRVCFEAHIDEFSKKLPNGLDTIVGQRGMMLSGGQKQRVAIARALIRNPSILILDEATSALDAVSEELIQKALENLTQGRTVLTIAHRLSTIRNAQNIIVLNDGGIAEQGCYQDLITNPNGIFNSLVKKQTFQHVPIAIEQQPLTIATELK